MIVHLDRTGVLYAAHDVLYRGLLWRELLGRGRHRLATFHLLAYHHVVASVCVVCCCEFSVYKSHPLTQSRHTLYTHSNTRAHTRYYGRKRAQFFRSHTPLSPWYCVVQLPPLPNCGFLCEIFGDGSEKTLQRVALRSVS